MCNTNLISYMLSLRSICVMKNLINALCLYNYCDQCSFLPLCLYLSLSVAVALILSVCLSLRGDIVACSWHPKGQIFASVDRNKKIALWKQ